MNYYDNTEYISNSILGKFKRDLKGKTLEFASDSLIRGQKMHAALLEPDEFDKIDYELKQDNIMQLAKLSDQFQALIDRSKKEHEIYRRLHGIKMRCKCDLYIKGYLVADFKFMKNNPKSARGAIDVIKFMDYDRQAYIYMELAKVDLFYFIFGNGFIFPIKKGDKIYESGKRKTIYLLEKYIILYGKI